MQLVSIGNDSGSGGCGKETPKTGAASSAKDDVCTKRMTCVYQVVDLRLEPGPVISSEHDGSFVSGPDIRKTFHHADVEIFIEKLAGKSLGRTGIIAKRRTSLRIYQ